MNKRYKMGDKDFRIKSTGMLEMQNGKVVVSLDFYDGTIKFSNDSEYKHSLMNIQGMINHIIVSEFDISSTYDILNTNDAYILKARGEKVTVIVDLYYETIEVTHDDGSANTVSLSTFARHIDDRYETLQCNQITPDTVLF
ncbi:MAG: hypothetical protein KAQ94_06620 [Arcobacteraceae bacterium]|nr:hypothetical protein [Arcobacteraceae bacterium]